MSRNNGGRVNTSNCEKVYISAAPEGSLKKAFKNGISPPRHVGNQSAEFRDPKKTPAARKSLKMAGLCALYGRE